MKNITYSIIAIFISGIVFAQSNISMTPQLEPLLIEFLNEAKLRDLNLKDIIIDRVDFILVKDLPEGFFGLIDRKYKIIYITTNLSYLELRLTLFHELGHILLNSGYHSCVDCFDVMAEYCVDINYYKNIDNWNMEVDKFFKLIKLNYDNSNKW